MRGGTNGAEGCAHLSTPSPSPPPAIDGDEFLQDASALESLLDGWDPEWSLSIFEGDKSADALPLRTEAQTPPLRRGNSSSNITTSASIGRPRLVLDEHKIEDTPVTSAKASAPPKTQQRNSSTWRQRQRLDVLELREMVKTLARQLEQLKLNRGIESTVPVEDRVALAGKRTSATRLTLNASGGSWRDVARCESMARQMATVENARLREIIATEKEYARKLRRREREMRRVDPLLAALRLPQGYPCAYVCRTPKDNGVVFTQLLAGLDDSYANSDDTFSTCGMSNLPCPGQASRVWVDQTRGLQAQLLDRYCVPFDDQSTAPAVWKVMSERATHESSVLYIEFFDWDANTLLTSQRTAHTVGALPIELLLRVACRKYAERNRTVFVAHRSMMVSVDSQVVVASDDVIMRTLERGELQTYVLTTYPSYRTASSLPPEAIVKWQQALKQFSLITEDVVLASKCRPRT